jgi:hypothetical protein
MSERAESSGVADGDFLDIEDRFAMVPEWLLDADVSDCAVRLYAVLLRFGQSSGARMPSRATLALRMRKKSTDTVDRAMRDLIAIGAVVVQPRYAGRERLTNLYRVRTSRPSGSSTPSVNPPAPTPQEPISGPEFVPDGGGRKFAATPISAAGRIRVASGTDAARVAADLRHNPKFFTERTTPPPAPSAGVTIAELCGIADWEEFVASCVARRREAGRPVGRWGSACLDAALQLAVRTRSWPASDAARALLAVAADPATHSPMRVAEAGPWWDGSAPATSKEVEEEVAAAEQLLAETGGLRVALQAGARQELSEEGTAVTRSTVAIRALRLLRETSPQSVSS